MTAPTPRRRPAAFAVTPTDRGLAVAEVHDFEPWPVAAAVLLFDEGGALVDVTTSTAKWGPVDELRKR